MSLKRLIAILMTMASLALTVCAQAPTALKLPDTAVGKRLAAFVKAFNSGDDKTMREFHTNNDAPGVLESMSLDEMSRMERQMFTNFGTLEPVKIIESGEHAITVLMKTRTGRWLRFNMEVEQGAPNKITTIGVEPAEPPAASDGASAKKLTAEEMAASLTEYLDSLAKEDRFSGVVLIAKDGKPIFTKAYGLANKSRNIPNRLDTKFNLGSMNKMFTAVAIAQLVEKGKLSFDDKVGKHIADYPNKEVAEKVTIHHLLTHTSGLGHYWNDKFEQNKAKIKTVSDYLALFVNDPLQFEPGARFNYSNSGFIVLGAIIEKVSGQSYYDYVREHIYRPAGMTNTDAYEMTEDTPNLAMGYTREGPEAGERRENTSSRPNRGGPAGGGYSTAEDLLKFHIALSSHKLLSPKMTALVTTGKVSNRGGKYGYGFGEHTRNGKRVFGHNGGAPGIASSLGMIPELGYTVIVMTNYDPPLMMPVVERIEAITTR